MLSVSRLNLIESVCKCCAHNKFQLTGEQIPRQEREEEGLEGDSFKREVAETFLRCKQQGFDQDNAVIELNSLKIAEDRTFAEVARYVFITILGARHISRIPFFTRTRA